VRKQSWTISQTLQRVNLRLKHFPTHKVRPVSPSYKASLTLIHRSRTVATVTSALGSAATAAQGLANQAYDAVMNATGTAEGSKK
jgi:hypothetical protein